MTQNTIWARGNFIKIGIPMGGMTWGVDNRTVARTFGGTVTQNTFIATSGYFGVSTEATATGMLADINCFLSVRHWSCRSQRRHCFRQQRPQGLVRQHRVSRLLLLHFPSPDPSSLRPGPKYDSRIVAGRLLLARHSRSAHLSRTRGGHRARESLLSIAHNTPCSIVVPPVSSQRRS